MAIQVKWLGHGSWEITIDDHVVLMDPFLDDSPTAPTKAADIDASHILVSHGHFDHVADVAPIANRCGATVVACFEVAQWFNQNHGVKETVGMNHGGGIELPFGHVKCVPAWHSSMLPDGSYGGNPCGFVITAAEKKIYFACDTALFSDMSLIGQLGIDLAVVPIGDLFTMGPADSLTAIKLLQPKFVLPAHYNTWPPIEQDAGAWAQRVSEETSAKPVVLAPGEVFSLAD